MSRTAPCRQLLRPALAASLALALLCAAPQALASRTSPSQPSVLEPDDTRMTPKQRQLLARAQGGDPYAQNEFGLLLATGAAGPKAPAEAVRWWTLAADKGLPDAQFNLGLAYDQGQGVAQNATQAAEWYEKAAAFP